MDRSKIEWTDASWNPIAGCTKVSAGCANCHALRMTVRLAHNPSLPTDVRERYARTVHKVGGEWCWTGEISLFSERLEQPLHWGKSRRVFPCSMSDLFHEDVPFEYIGKAFASMIGGDQHTYQLLTKRPDRMLEFVIWFQNKTQIYMRALRHIWLGVTVENQTRADARIPILVQVPAAVRFVSVEPMLGPVDILGYLDACDTCTTMHDDQACSRGFNMCLCNKIAPGIDWIICGGETGPGARPMHPDWARSLRDQCGASGIEFFFKQWGAWSPIGIQYTLNVPGWHRFSDGQTVEHIGKKAAGRLLDGQIWDQMPEASR